MHALALLLLLAATPEEPVRLRHAPGTLHGFPSMSDRAGRVVADGELVQERDGARLAVRVRWEFADGRRAEERDEFRVGASLEQRSFAWIETEGGAERRRFEVDLSTGAAVAVVRDGRGEPKREEARLELPRGRSFAGYGIALAAGELGLAEGHEAHVTIVAFTDAPRAVRLAIRREGRERIAVAGRPIPCDRYVLHPELPFPVSVVAGARDAHLWFTSAAPPALVRARQTLVTKDDPEVVIDVTPRGPARAGADRRAQARKGGARAR